MPKKNKLYSVIKYAISIVLSAVLLFLVFKKVDFSTFYEKSKEVNFGWVLVSILLSIFAFLARAFRWNILLEPLGKKLQTQRTFLAVMVGYLTNLALPRAGEITRCGVLNKNDQVPFSYSFGSVFTERIIDLLFLMLLMLLSLTIEVDFIANMVKNSLNYINISTEFIIILIILFVFIVIFVIKKKNKFSGFLKKFIEGILSLRHIKRPYSFIASTIFIWIMYFLMTYVIVFSLPETAHLGIGVGFMLLVVGAIAIILPVQGGFGTYHVMLASTLILYGINDNTSIFLATLLHTSQVITIVLLGTIALIISFQIRKNVANIVQNKTT